MFFSKLLKVFSLVVLLVVGLFVSSPVPAYAQLAPSRETICGGRCPLIDLSNLDSTFSKENVVRFIIAIARFLTFIGVALAVIFFVWAGIQFIIGKGDEGKSTIFNALIGLVVIIIAYTVVVLITSFLQGDVISSDF